MTVAEYRATPALNYSWLKHWFKSPEHFRLALWEQIMRKLNPEHEDFEPSGPMQLGTAVHALVQGFQTFASDVIRQPDKRSTQGKVDFKANKGLGIIQLPKAQWTAYEIIPYTLDKDPEVKAYVASIRDSGTIKEKPLMGEIEGVPCKALADAFRPGYYLNDIKVSARDPYSFIKYLRDEVSVQLAFYREIIRQNYEGDMATVSCLQIVADAPYTHMIHYFSPEGLDVAFRKIQSAIKDIRDKQPFVLESYQQAWEGPNYWQPERKFYVPELGEPIYL